MKEECITLHKNSDCNVKLQFIQCFVISLYYIVNNSLCVQVFDRVLNNVLNAGVKSDDCSDIHSGSDDVTGYHTIRFLFAFGSSCFERYLQLL